MMAKAKTSYSCDHSSDIEGLDPTGLPPPSLHRYILQVSYTGCNGWTISQSATKLQSTSRLGYDAMDGQNQGVGRGSGDLGSKITNSDDQRLGMEAADEGIGKALR